MTRTPDDLSGTSWRTSSYSAASGDCVEVARLPGGRWAVRDSKDPDGPALTFPPAGWGAFLAGVHDGEFDVPAPPPA